METKRQPKAFARIGDVRFVLNGTTVTAQQRCVSVGGSECWHHAGRIGLEALMTAARHGLRSYLAGRMKCWQWRDGVGEVVFLHECWLSADDAKVLLVRVDERQQVTP